MAIAVPQAQAETLTVANGRTTTNDIVPIYGFYYDTGFKTTVVYPATMLSEMNGGAINSITFTANASFTALQGGKVKVSVGEIEGTVASGFFSGLNQVFEGTPSCSGAQCTITFDEPIDYNGGNLAIECYLTEKGNNCPTINFYGITQGYNASYYAYGSSLYNGNTGVDFLPEAIFDYDGAVAVDYAATVSPENLAFGKLAVDGTKTLPVTLKNKGTNAFTPTVTISGTGFSTTYTSAEIASKGSATISVVFNPTQVGDYSGTLTITFPAETGLDPVTVPLSGSAAQEVTINEGENTSTYLPLYMPGYNTQKNQMIYPAEMLSGIVGKTIKGLTFYNQGSTFNGKINLALGTTDQTVYTTYNTPVEGLTQVVTNQSVAEGNTLDVLFDNTFEYTGGNLVIQIEVADKGTNNSYSGTSITWLGTTQTENTGYYYYTSSYSWGAVQKFLPTVTFAFEDGNTPAVPTIVADPATVDAFTTEVGTPVTATVNVAGENLTGDITATVSGDDAFTAVLENGVLTITYNPTAAGNHTATLTLSSEGARNVTIELSGTATAPAVPTITVNPATLAINAALGETKTASFTVTGTNLEGDITIAASEGFTVSPTTIAAAYAEAGATVTVTYVAPATAETKTGTITLTSENAETKTVAITATAADITYDFTVEPESLDFGEVYVGQSKTLAVTVHNNSSENIQPVFTFNNNVFSVEDASYPAYAELSQTYNIIYTPAVAGTDNGTVTISVGSQAVTVDLTGKGKELAAYDITSTAASGVHNFGDAFVNGTASWSFTITNNGKNAVTPTIEGLAEPFSTTYESATIASGESATITINFKPTAIQAYGPTSIVVKFNETEDFQFDYTLRGNGIENTGTLPPSFYDNIEYTWTDANGDTQTSKLTEIATDPDQMIALMREVYTNKNLPGNFYRGYNANGEPEDEVAYPAIGKIVANYTSGVGYSYEYSDAYGWNIGNNAQQYPIKSYDEGTSSSSYHLKYFDPTEYKPNDEGLTLLLVEMRDNEVDDNGNITTEWTAQYSIDMETSSTTGYSYSDLRTMFGNLFKSVRVVPNSKRVTKNDVEGTLFKVDCDKMNRFFFLAKGRLRKADNSPKNPGEDWWANGSPNLRWRGSSASSPSYSEKVNREPFYQMFEQLSPVSLSNQVNTKDVYQALVNMESYNIEHDCQTIPFSTTSTNTGHEFCLYGKESISDDCQDVRDLMFFVPDLRMKNWSGRNDGNADVFVNYYEEYAPSIALYVIRQNEITGERNGEAEEYTLHLSWESNLTDFVPGENGEYTIYLVNDDGTYTPVAEHIPSSQTTYTLTVDMQQHGQQVTYVIQGQDNTRFLSLQYSNEESFIIPGLDPDEKFQMVPNVAYYSRFDPQTEQNFYANGMQIKGYPDATVADYAGKTMNFYRKAAGDNEEWTLVGTAAVSSDGTSATVSMVDATQRKASEYKFGYMQNPESVSITTDENGYKVFGVIYDNFKADVSANDHAASYSYKMEVNGEQLHSNEMSIKVFKTAMSNITGSFDLSYVENDDVRQDADKGTEFDINVEHSSKTEILRYGTYRWDSSFGTETNPYAVLNLNSSADDEEDISPAGQASNQGEYYSVYMNGDSYIGDDVYVAQGQTGKATFVDNFPETAVDEYTYAPVIETFTGRSDYNTYGAPMQETATGELDITVGEKKQAGDVTWTADSKTYTYYNVCLNVNEIQIPQGYEVAMLRAWRQIDESYLGEQEGKGYENRAVLDDNGDFLFLKDAENGFGDIIGDEILVNQEGQYGNIFSGTFGAVKLENGQTIPMKFTVRVYFTKSESTSNAPRLKAEGESKKYYITEIELNDELTSDIPTSIFGVISAKAVAGVKYYNVAGLESDRPFQGVNIEVTRYTDGSKSTRKILK